MKAAARVYNGGMKPVSLPPEGPLARYPKIRLRVAMGAGGSVAQRLGVKPAQRAIVIDLESEEVSKAMGALGWERVGTGEAGLAVSAMESLIDAMVESAAWASGYEIGFQGLAGDVLGKMDPRFAECLEGRAPWRPGALAAGAWIDVGLYLSSHREVSGAEWMAMHERAAQELAATLLEQFARLGASASIGWSEGIRDWSQSVSRLPEEWRWPTLGAALCVELEDESAVCASFSAHGVKALAQSPLGRALGPRAGFALLASAKPMKIVCGAHRGARAYGYGALPGMPGAHFPCVTIQARSAWRGPSAATAEEAMAAARAVAGPKGLLSVDWVAPSAEAPGAAAREGVQRWLGGCEALIQAKKIRRSLGGQAKKGAPGGPKRRL